MPSSSDGILLHPAMRRPPLPRWLDRRPEWRSTLRALHRSTRPRGGQARLRSPNGSRQSRPLARRAAAQGVKQGEEGRVGGWEPGRVEAVVRRVVRTLHAQLSLLQIHVAPAERHDLAAPQSGFAAERHDQPVECVGRPGRRDQRLVRRKVVELGCSPEGISIRAPSHRSSNMPTIRRAKSTSVIFGWLVRCSSTARRASST